MKKQKKGSILILFGILLIVAGFVLLVVNIAGIMGAASSGSASEGDILKAGGLYFAMIGCEIVGWPLLIAGIVIAIVRATRARRLANQEKQQAQNRNRESVPVSSPRDRRSDRDVGAPVSRTRPVIMSRPEPAKEEPKPEPKPMPAPKSAPSGEKLDLSGYSDLVEDEDFQDLVSSLFDVLLPEDEEDEVWYDFRERHYDAYDEIVEALDDVRQDKSELIDALSTLGSQIDESVDDPSSPKKGYRIVTPEVVIKVISIFYGNGLVIEALDLLEGIRELMQQYDNGDYENFYFTMSDNDDYMDRLSEIERLLSKMKMFFVFAYMEYVNYESGEPGYSPEYIKHLSEVLVRRGNIAYHGGLDVEVDLRYSKNMDLDFYYNDLMEFTPAEEIEEAKQEMLSLHFGDLKL